jgi:hypothetical protein
MESLPIERALELLGQRLEYLAAPPTLLLVGGGAALNLLGLVVRTTQDVDIIALVHSESGGVAFEKAEPLPTYLREASEQVALDLGLPRTWLNPGPTSLLDFGLPSGCLDRAIERSYGSRLRLLLLSRLDQIHLKLYAAVDQRGGRHLADLQELRPAADELLAAARWTKTHDPSQGFHQELAGLLRQIGYDDVAEQL